MSQHMQKVPHHFIFSACRSCGRQHHGCRNYITSSSMCAGPVVCSNVLWWAVSWMLHLGSPMPGTHKGLALSFRPAASYMLLLYMLCLLPGILPSHIPPPSPLFLFKHKVINFNGELEFNLWTDDLYLYFVLISWLTGC